MAVLGDSNAVQFADPNLQNDLDVVDIISKRKLYNN